MTERLARPVDIAGLAAFRIALGSLVAVSSVRFLAYGWVDALFVSPTFRFKYWGFEWVPHLSAPWMHAVFAAMAGLGLCVALGLFYRVSVVLLALAFTYVQLVDVTNYLNHYYLVSLLLWILCFTPCHRAFSVDAWLRPALATGALPAFYLTLLRFQVGVVYIFAGLAKLNGDWLLRAQPLSLWLRARSDLPWIGDALAAPTVAFVASWAGFLFDTTVVFFLLSRRTRPFAYGAVLVFHAATWALFPIGMFPFIMVTAALVFFDPGWPRRWLGARASGGGDAGAGLRVGLVHRVAAVVFCGVQLVLPLRAHLYGGDVLWHEQGMRFSWRVMTREKNGAVTFTVRDVQTGRETYVSPSEHLTRLQEREMSSQPDLILQLARHLAEQHRRAGKEVEVRVDAKVSLNGRPAAPLIDPTVDLARQEDGLRPKRWILPEPRAAGDSESARYFSPPLSNSSSACRCASSSMPFAAVRTLSSMRVGRDGESPVPGTPSALCCR